MGNGQSLASRVDFLKASRVRFDYGLNEPDLLELIASLSSELGLDVEYEIKRRESLKAGVHRVCGLDFSAIFVPQPDSRYSGKVDKIQVRNLGMLLHSDSIDGFSLGVWPGIESQPNAQEIYEVYQDFARCAKRIAEDD